MEECLPNYKITQVSTHERSADIRQIKLDETKEAVSLIKLKKLFKPSWLCETVMTLILSQLQPDVSELF